MQKRRKCEIVASRRGKRNFSNGGRIVKYPSEIYSHKCDVSPFRVAG